MTQEPPAPEHQHSEAIDHLEEELKSLEGVTRFGKPIRIAVLVVALVAAVAGTVWWVLSPPPVTSGGSSNIATGSPIEVAEPKRDTFSEPPARFAWESVTGRLQYVVRIYIKGSSTPVLEKRVTAALLELTPDERARMPRGNTFVWTVVAQGKDGSNIGAGQSTFKVK